MKNMEKLVAALDKIVDEAKDEETKRRALFAIILIKVL